MDESLKTFVIPDINTVALDQAQPLSTSNMGDWA